MSNIRIHVGDCRDVMAEMEPNSMDTIITDPPYGLQFMGKDWDHGVPGTLFWEAALRVAQPGAMMLAFGGTRTHHRLMCAIEDAGWVIRDVIMWVYGSGFPKSHNISKAIDKAAGAEREVVGTRARQPGYSLAANKDDRTAYGAFTNAESECAITSPATDAAKLWDGWGTALKPAYEPIIVAMKPLNGTFAQNAQKWGVAGLWIDGGRVPAGDDYQDGGARYRESAMPQMGSHQTRPWVQRAIAEGKPVKVTKAHDQGRWPANLIHDGSEEVVGLFPQTKSGKQAAGGHVRNSDKHRNTYAPFEGQRCEGDVLYGDSGSAARFFYCAKASRSERTANGVVENPHPTVKPLALLRYLCRITKTPTGGVILDPFMGSGSTLRGALLEERSAIGIEISEEYAKIAAELLRADAPMFNQVEVVK